MNAKKMVIVGSGGRLGRELLTRYATDYSVTGFDHAALDLGCTESIKTALLPLEYDLLILSGALTAVDYCESNEKEAYAVNAEAPHEVAKISASKDAKVVYFSTDFVFDGQKKEPYLEDDEPNPISIYGQSKLQGEDYVLGVSPDNLVVRLAWLYGASRPAFPEWIIDKARSESDLSLPAEKLGCPTNCSDLGALLDPLLVGGGAEAAKGILHLCNSGVCSWREWGQACLEIAMDLGLPLLTKNIGESALSKVEAFVAERPINSAMSTSKYSRMTGIVPRGWEEALRAHLKSADLG